MKFVHRFVVSSSPQIQSELAAFDIHVKDDGLWPFEIEESSRFWPEVQRWVAAQDDRPLHSITTEFSDEEVARASWLCMLPTGHFGYPQPDGGWYELTYDLKDRCEKCDLGRKQRAPFRMIGEPKWGRRRILQMNWVFDEFFVTPEVWRNIFKPHGIEFLPVLGKAGKELDTVVQLVIGEEVSVVTKDLQEQSKCLSCGRTSYSYVSRGVNPPLVGEPKAGIVRTKEWFGSGLAAFNLVLVSQGLARDLIVKMVRGVSFSPIAERE